MLEIFIEHYKSVGLILLYTIIFLIIFMIFYYKILKEEIGDNWSKYRDKPYMLLIGGLFKREKGQSFLEATKANFIKVLFGMVKKIMDVLMIPIYPILKMVMKVFKSFTFILNNVRNQITVMRNFLFKIFEKMYIRLQNSFAAVIFFFLKLRESLKRSYGILTLLVYTIEHSFLFFESLMKSPLTKFGGWAEEMGLGMSMFVFGDDGIPLWHNALCFGENTYIKLNDNSKILIKNITIDDVLINNNKILAKITIHQVYNLYKLDNVYVTGDHLVYDCNKIKRVSEVERSIKVNDNLQNNLISLVTLNQLIHINDLVFKDYLDTHDITINKYIRQLVYQYLNNENCTDENTGCEDLISGISCNCLNTYDIIGTIEISPGTLTLYKYNNEILSGNILVKHNNKWKRVSNLKESKLIGKNVNKCIHYITKNNIIKTPNNEIRDFCESNNLILNQKIDNYIDNFYKCN